MKRFKVNLDRIGKIKNFVQATSAMNCDIDVVSGRFIVDAKSIMGIFALDLSNNVDVVMHTEDEDLINKFKSRIEGCIVA